MNDEEKAQPTPQPPQRIWDDATALDQLAAILGLYNTNPGNNPLPEVMNDINTYVQNTGRRTDQPEGG